jgi:hypothetical protein
MNATVNPASQNIQTFGHLAHLGGLHPLSLPTAIHHRLRVVGRHLIFSFRRKLRAALSDAREGVSFMRLGGNFRSQP